MSTEPDPLQLELERAQTLVELGRYEEASAVLTQLLAREPEVAPAWCLFAQAQIAAGDSNSGLDAAERAASLEPENEWAHRLRSAALQNLGRPGAIAAAREAVAAAPHVWLTHNRLATVLAAANQNPDAALAAAERAVELAPNEPDAHRALGRAYEMRDDHAEAERCYRLALSLDPQNAAAHDALARRRLTASRRFGAGNLAAAASGFRDVVQANPRSAAGAANIEIIIRGFLSRLSYLVFVCVWASTLVTNHSGPSAAGRAVPLLLAAIPVGFGLRFLVSLAPDLRRRVGYMAFHGWLAPASYANAVALPLLVVSAAGPSGARIGFAVAAFLLSLAARVYLLWLRRRSRQA